MLTSIGVNLWYRWFSLEKVEFALNYQTILSTDLANTNGAQSTILKNLVMSLNLQYKGGLEGVVRLCSEDWSSQSHPKDSMVYLKMLRLPASLYSVLPTHRPVIPFCVLRLAVDNKVEDLTKCLITAQFAFFSTPSTLRADVINEFKQLLSHFNSSKRILPSFPSPTASTTSLSSCYFFQKPIRNFLVRYESANEVSKPRSVFPHLSAHNQILSYLFFNKRTVWNLCPNLQSDIENSSLLLQTIDLRDFIIEKILKTRLRDSYILVRYSFYTCIKVHIEYDLIIGRHSNM